MTEVELKTTDATNEDIVAKVVDKGIEANTVILDEAVANTAGLAVTDLPNETEAAPVMTPADVAKMASTMRLGGQKGFRQVGSRKAGLLAAIGKELRTMQKKGINGDYILKNHTKWKGTLKTPTKQLSGILSQLKTFIQD